MTTNRNRAVAALTAAGLLWGTTVPLSKLAMEWLPPGWLTAARFGVAAAILLAVARRRGLRRAFTPLVLASGAVGYGGSVLLQNAGIARTSVTQAALLIGAVPVLVAVIAAIWHRTVAAPVAWAGFAVSLAGVALVTRGHGGGATLGGDGLVLVSLLLSATFTVAQTRLLAGRDPVSVTAVQFLGAALAGLTFSAATEGLPPAPHAAGAVLVTAALALGGTLAPFTLFAYGQSRVAAVVAGAFVNIEPLVGAVAGIVLFGNPAGPAQAIGGAAILGGIALSSLPLIGGRAAPAPDPVRPDDADPVWREDADVIWREDADPVWREDADPVWREDADPALALLRKSAGSTRWPAGRRRPRRAARRGTRGPAEAGPPRRTPDGGPGRGSARSRDRCAAPRGRC
jgi:O-acetylserine/cysteine efflux transporter